jgi:biopolymer transport protein ExbD
MAVKLGQIDGDLTETHEINVTPFIDVMLVLLVIFMVTAPLTTVDVPVTLPVADAAAKPPPEKPVFVTLQADLSTSVGDERVGRNDVASKIVTLTDGNRQTQIFLRADKTVSYDHLMDLLNVLGNAGYLRVALVGTDANTGDAAAASNP